MSNVIPFPARKTEFKVNDLVRLKHAPTFRGIVRAVDCGELWIFWLSAPASRETGPISMFELVDLEARA